MKRLTAVLLCLAAVGPAFAEEPAGFAGLLWGAPMQDVVAHPMGCKSLAKIEPSLSVPGVVTCVGDRMKLHDGPGAPSATPTFAFVGERLAGYSFGRGLYSSDAVLYFQLREIAVKKFGEPHSQSKSELRHPTNGTAMPNERMEWRWPSGTSALLMQHCGLPYRTCLDVRSEPLVKAHDKADAERAASKPRF